jgi:hypothetical protein
MTLLTCAAVRRRLSAFYDRELPIRDLIAIEAHLQGCPPCARELATLQGVGEALRMAAAPGPADDWTGLQPGVISRMRAEAHESWPARAGRLVDDVHLVWIGLAATVATFICGAVALSALHFASPERHDSLRAVIAVISSPLDAAGRTGGAGGPALALDPGPLAAEDLVHVPLGAQGAVMGAMLAHPMSEEELVLAISGVVMRDGRVQGLSGLKSAQQRAAINSILDAISRAKLEPGRYGDVVWLLTHTTVRTRAPRTI